MEDALSPLISEYVLLKFSSSLPGISSVQSHTERGNTLALHVRKGFLVLLRYFLSSAYSHNRRTSPYHEPKTEDPPVLQKLRNFP